MTSVLRLSHNLNLKTPGFGGKSEFDLSYKKLISKGDSCNQSGLFVSMHLGTHVDSPFHFCENGKKISDYSDEHWICHKPILIDYPILKPGQLIEIEGVADQISTDSDILLIRTGFERYRNEDRYWSENPGLTAQSGEWLRKNRPHIKFVGFDFISLTSYLHREEGRLAHRAFLQTSRFGNPIMIIEDMSLLHLNKTPYRVLISPIFVDEAEGSPVTVWAEQD